MLGLWLCAVLAVGGWYLSISAGRLDRLHHKVEAARAAVDVQFVRRAVAAREVAVHLAPSEREFLLRATRGALDAGESAVEAAHVPPTGSSATGPGWVPDTRSERIGQGGRGHAPRSRARGEESHSVGLLEPDLELAGWEQAESVLTRAIAAAFTDPRTAAVLRADPGTRDEVDLLYRACQRAQFARRFHNDAVAQVQRVRRKRIVRWTGLAGRAAWPRMVDLDDAIAPGLDPSGCSGRG